jgi:hypothetical protein
MLLEDPHISHDNLVSNEVNIHPVLKSELAALSDREGELIGNMKCFADSPTHSHHEFSIGSCKNLSNLPHLE